MKRSPTFFAAFVLSSLALIWSGSAFAQDPSQQEPGQTDPSIVQPQPDQTPPPKPAGRGPGWVDESDAVTDTGVPIIPDSTPLTGVQVATIGSQAQRHSYVVPGFQYGNFLRSSTLEAPQVGDWNSTSFLAGNLSLLQQWTHAQLAVNYTGGGTFSTDSLQGNSYYQQMEIQQTIETRHAKFSLIDQFDYLPQSDFGFGASSPLAIAGIGGPLGPSLPALQSNYQPNQSIFTTIGSRYSNSATAQLAYFLSPRSQFTVSGSYGILRFLDPGNIESNDTILSLGYDYQVSRRDTLGILYRYTDYRYLGNPQAIEDHVAQLAYGHKITGRTSIQLFVGSGNHTVSRSAERQVTAHFGCGRRQLHVRSFAHESFAHLQPQRFGRQRRVYRRDDGHDHGNRESPFESHLRTATSVLATHAIAACRIRTSGLHSRSRS